MKELLEIGISPWVVIPALTAMLALLIAFGPKMSHQGRPVRQKKLLTPNEREFLNRLRRALPAWEVLPQVSMVALLDVNLPEHHPNYWAIKQAFAMKVVDYVVCRKGTLDVAAVVELDDRTHDNKRDKDAARDALLLSAGIPTVRWDSRAKPAEGIIAATMLSVVGKG